MIQQQHSSVIISSWQIETVFLLSRSNKRRIFLDEAERQAKKSQNCLVFQDKIHPQLLLTTLHYHWSLPVLHNHLLSSSSSKIIWKITKICKFSYFDLVLNFPTKIPSDIISDARCWSCSWVLCTIQLVFSLKIAKFNFILISSICFWFCYNRSTHKFISKQSTVSSCRSPEIFGDFSLRRSPEINSRNPIKFLLGNYCTSQLKPSLWISF